jgi:hypothetical protein
MNGIQILQDSFGRVREAVHEALDGLSPELAALPVQPGTNTIAWLVWHLTRVQDDHVSEVAGREQVWTAQGWAERFALPFDVTVTGYGQEADDVAALRATPELLLGYYEAVHDSTVQYLAGLGGKDLDRVVDEAWDPPVTLGVRLVSVVSDDLQHAGQAALVRGVLERRAPA